MPTRKQLGFWELVAVGVGGMVGGGIFAVLGLAVTLAGGGTPVAFALAGVIALITLTPDSPSPILTTREPSLT
jgi:amino acid transporter